MDSFVFECVCVCVFSSVQFYHMQIHVAITMVKVQNSSITDSPVLPTFIGIVTFLLSLAFWPVASTDLLTISLILLF